MTGLLGVQTSRWLPLPGRPVAAAKGPSLPLIRTKPRSESDRRDATPDRMSWGLRPYWPARARITLGVSGRYLVARRRVVSEEVNGVVNADFSGPGSS